MLPGSNIYILKVPIRQLPAKDISSKWDPAQFTLHQQQEQEQEEPEQEQKITQQRQHVTIPITTITTTITFTTTTTVSYTHLDVYKRQLLNTSEVCNKMN